MTLPGADNSDPSFRIFKYLSILILKLDTVLKLE